MRLFVFLILFTASFSLRAEELLFKYNPNSVQTFEGDILSVQKYHFVNRPTSHTQFILHTQSGNKIVEVGPEWYIEAEGVNLAPSDRVSVTGSVMQKGAKTYIVAKSLRSKDLELHLRDEAGLPLWSQLQHSDE